MEILNSKINCFKQLYQVLIRSMKIMFIPGQEYQCLQVSIQYWYYETQQHFVVQ